MQTLTRPIINPVQSLFGRFRRVGIAGYALALLVVISTGALAQSSGQRRPFKCIEAGTYDGGGSEGTGQATHLGKFIVTVRIEFVSFDSVTGLYQTHNFATYQAANGELLFSESTTELYVYEPQWVQVGHETFTGGTGRFEYATGESIWVADVFPTSETLGTWSAINEGFLTY